MSRRLLWAIVAGLLVWSWAVPALASPAQFAPTTFVELQVHAPAPYGESRLTVEFERHEPPGRLPQPTRVARFEFVSELGRVEIPPEAYHLVRPYGLHVTTAEKPGEQDELLLAINMRDSRGETLRIFILNDRVIGHHDRRRSVQFIPDADPEIIDHPLDPLADRPEKPEWFEVWRAATRKRVPVRAVKLFAYAPEPYGRCKVVMELSAPDSDSETQFTRFDFVTEEGPVKIPPAAYEHLRQPRIETARLTYSRVRGLYPPGPTFVSLAFSVPLPDGSLGGYQLTLQNGDAIWYRRNSKSSGTRATV